MYLNLILAFSSVTTSNFIEIFMQVENTHFIATSLSPSHWSLVLPRKYQLILQGGFLVFCIMTRQMLIGPGRQQHCSAHSLPRIRNNLDDMNYFMKVTEQDFLLSLLAHCKTHNSLAQQEEACHFLSFEFKSFQTFCHESLNFLGCFDYLISIELLFQPL